MDTLDSVLYILDNLSNNHWTMCPIVIGQCVQYSLDNVSNNHVRVRHDFFSPAIICPIFFHLNLILSNGASGANFLDPCSVPGFRKLGKPCKLPFNQIWIDRVCHYPRLNECSNTSPIYTSNQYFF